MDTYFLGEALHGRDRHAAGREILEKLYFQATGQALPPICIAPGGKPYFAAGPWHFSISHTKHFAFCALSRRNIGLDAEELARQADPRLSTRILSAGEQAQYALASDKNRALLTFWVLKEAQGKLTGAGFQYPCNQTEFSLSDPRVHEHLGCLVAVVTEDDHVI